MISAKPAYLAGLMLAGALMASAQTYWTTNASTDCGIYGDSNSHPKQLTSGPGAGNYVCWVYGTLPWYAAGAGWTSAIRTSAPPTGAVNLNLYFTDVNGADRALDYRIQGNSTVYNDTGVTKVLSAEQPWEVDLLGLHAEAPNYSTTSATGPVVVYAECPDGTTCGQLQAQLIYSALPSQPWSLSAPVVWDPYTWNVWSSIGIDDGKGGVGNGGTDTLSFVIYNLADDQLAHTYTLNVYDSTGALYSSGTTASVPYLGSYAAVLKQVISNLPSGPFKLQLAGASTQYAIFEVLQFHGPSATTLVSGTETLPAASAAAAAGVNFATGQRSASSIRHRVPPAGSIR